MLSVKKILAGRGAVNYYLEQTRRGLADYYLPEQSAAHTEDVGCPVTAPGSAWWGGGTDALGLDGEVGRAQFVPLYAKGAHPDGGYLGRKFRTQEKAAEQRAERLAAIDLIDDAYDRWQAKQQLAKSGPAASVAAWDATFSPAKSVSLLWASGDRNVQQQVWAAHLAAVDAGLGYLQEHAALVRAGRNGIRVLDSDGLVVARMNEWSSREGDMQLHTHCVILNRARTTVDGKWRALDGRALLAAKPAAGAVYHRVLEAELSRRLGVVWRTRPDGLRELDGVSDELIATFSSRRRAITSQVDELVAAYEDRYGVPPPPAVRHRMAQDATLTTRPTKRELSADEALDVWEAQARRTGTELADLPARVLDRPTPRPPTSSSGDQFGRLLAQLRDSDRASFTRHELLRAALDALDSDSRPASVLRAEAEQLVDRLVDSELAVALHADDPVKVDDTFRRADGHSIFDRPARQRWTLYATLDREAWLCDVAAEPIGLTVDDTVVGDAVGRHGLGPDQTAAVTGLLADARRVGLLVGPAGAGKTRTLRAVVDAWQRDGGQVIGLTVSQAAAEVLAAEAQVRAENTAKWLHETRHHRWQLPERPLLLVDEASMVSTDDLVALVSQARRAGGKVLLVGDPAQLAAIRAGGAFDLLAERHGAARLTEIRRFTHRWEADASLALRDRDPAAIDAYAMRGRIHAGPHDQIETGLFAAWEADALGVDDHGRRETVAMIVGTNDQAAALGHRARQALMAAGHVHPGPTVALADNVASVGDHLVTRRNDRQLVTDDRTGWVVNGDTWTITQVHRNGDARATRHRDGATLTLPAGYLAEHTHLAYATTTHRAQGMTVDRAHAALDADTTHQQLYVAATRGRHSNDLWVTLDTERDVIADTHLPEPARLLARILDRPDPAARSAHQTADADRRELHSLARLGAIFEDAARDATDRWLTSTLETHGLGAVVDDPQWGSLLDTLRHHALHGHDLDQLLGQAIRMRPLDDVHSVAGVLHWRLNRLAGDTAPARRPGPLGSLPPLPEDDAHLRLARRVGELIRQRWHRIRQHLGEVEGTLGYARVLGPRPDDPGERRSWLTAVTAVTAYRQRYDLPDHVQLLGPRPGPLRPDAQAAYDHAQLQADRHLARPYLHLDPAELRQAVDQHETARPDVVGFDPDQLTTAHTDAVASRRRWHTVSPPDRDDARLQHERHQAVIAALERLATQRADTDARLRDHDDRRRQLALPTRSRR